MKKRYLRKRVDITLIAIEVMLSPVLMIDDFEATSKSFAIVIVWALAFALIGRILIKHSKCLEKLISDDHSKKGIKKTISTAK